VKGLEVRFAPDGIEIAGGLIWLDATRPKPFGLITHAHGDHVARHKRILSTPATAALFRKRNGPGPEFLERRYAEPTRVGDLSITLLPAGHILGSAMALVEGRGQRLLYTGDVRIAGGLTCPPAQPVKADILITEATFGLPRHRFEPAPEVRARILEFARRTLDEGSTPVFLAYALGKAQELMALFSRAAFPVAAHGTVWNLCTVYREFGITFPASRRLGRSGVRKAAVIVPRRFLMTPAVQAAAPLKVAAVTGWGARALRPEVDRVFRLSDHSDHAELLRLVEHVAPRTVYVVHGYAREFAAELAARGFDAQPVEGHAGPA